MIFPDKLKYTKDHEWVHVEGTTGTIGVTDYAQSELGDVVFVDITDTSEVKQGEAFGTIEAVKTVSDIYAPLSGKSSRSTERFRTRQKSSIRIRMAKAGS